MQRTFNIWSNNTCTILKCLKGGEGRPIYNLHHSTALKLDKCDYLDTVFLKIAQIQKDTSRLVWNLRIYFLHCFQKDVSKILDISCQKTTSSGPKTSKRFWKAHLKNICFFIVIGLLFPYICIKKKLTQFFCFRRIANVWQEEHFCTKKLSQATIFQKINK